MQLKSLLTALLLGLWSSAVSQSIKINFPVERMVFQRDQNNECEITVSGTYTGDIDKVDVRLVVIEGGTTTDWLRLDAAPSNGMYRGTVRVKGGWYRLEVRKSFKNVIDASSSVAKVGVGEVFVIAGQSNAQGVLNFSNTDQPDDRVNCMANNYFIGNSNVQFPRFERIKAKSKICPMGNGGWFWGFVGAKIAQKENVPVLFFNTSFESTSVEDWIESSKGVARINAYSFIPFPNGFPFNNFKKTLLGFVSLTGYRSIIWHQGENDNYLKTSQEKYISQMKSLIYITRKMTEENANWMICRASKYANFSNTVITEAQTKSVEGLSNVVLGPNTDVIDSRVDGTHFGDMNFNALANLFEPYFDQTFFLNATPILPKKLLSLSTVCNSNQTELNVKVEDNYKNYLVNGESTQTKSFSGGVLTATAEDQTGRIFFSPPLEYDVASFAPPRPKIVVDGPLLACREAIVKVSTDKASVINWSNGKTTQTISVNYPSVLNVTVTNEYGCKANADELLIKAYPPGPPPLIFAAGSTIFCEGGSVTIAGDVFGELTWNNGTKASNIVVNKTGAYFARKIDNNNCLSEASNVLNVEVKPKPSTPSLETIGTFTLAVKNPADNQTFLWYKNGTELPQKTGYLKVSELAKFQAKTVDNFYSSTGQPFSCVSDLSAPFEWQVFPIASGISVFPNPVTTSGFSVDINQVLTNATIYIYDAQGVLWHSLYMANLDRAVEIKKALPIGTYFITVLASEGKKTARFIVN